MAIINFAAFVLLLQIVTSRHTSSQHYCPALSTYPTAFKLQAIETSTNASMVLAPVPNISFDEPGTLYLGGDPHVTFNLTNYALSTASGTAPCALQAWAPSNTLAITKCSTNPAARAQGNPYFSIGYDEFYGVQILQIAYPNVTGTGSACGMFANVP